MAKYRFYHQKPLLSIMKKTLYIVMVLIAGVLMASCGKKAELKKFVTEMNDGCPYTYEQFGQLSSVAYDDNDVVMQFDIAAGTLNIKSINSHQELAKDAFLSSLCLTSKDDNNINELFQLICDADAGLVFVFDVPNEGSCRLNFSSDEIKKATENVDISPKQVLNARLKLQNLQLPLPLGNGIVWTQAVIENGYVVYEYECDDDIVTNLNSQKNYLAIQLKSSLTTNAIAAAEAQIIKGAGYGIAYKYQGTHGNVCIITFENSEL